MLKVIGKLDYRCWKGFDLRIIIIEDIGDQVAEVLSSDNVPVNLDAGRNGSPMLKVTDRWIRTSGRSTRSFSMLGGHFVFDLPFFDQPAFIFLQAFGLTVLSFWERDVSAFLCLFIFLIRYSGSPAFARPITSGKCFQDIPMAEVVTVKMLVEFSLSCFRRFHTFLG